MPINYIPNDPSAGDAAPSLRKQAKRANRPASRSGFDFPTPSPESAADPGTPQFLFWQSREAAIAAVEAWEAASGAQHKAWQADRKKLPLHQDDGIDLNASYDRSSFSFFHESVGGAMFFSGASTDCVAHEVGHGLLDSLRPDLWDVTFLEVGAVHEAVGDIVAILTALEDTDTRKKLLAGSPDLRKRNFVESTCEDLARAIGIAIPNHNAAEARHAFNTLKFQIPSTLPTQGGPGALLNEVHSFGMIFTGCFWDLLANLYNASSKKNEAALRTASRLAGKLLIEGLRGAVVQPRFMQSIGRSMVLADQALNAGANHAHIRDAFAAHDIALGANAMLAPSAVLAGNAPKGAVMSAATRKDVRRRLGNVAGAKLAIGKADLFGTQAATAVQTRGVALGSLHPKLKGVVALAQEQLVVGSSGRRAAVMGAIPHASDTDAEVLSYVESLLAHGRIAIEAPKKRAAATGRRSAAAIAKPWDHTTHEIRSVGGKKVLKRTRFQCGC